MQASQNIVLFGASGFVGGSVLHALLTKPASASATVIAVTSSAAKAAQIQAWGHWLGTKLETQVVTKEGSWRGATPLAAEADLVIQAATSDDLELTEAINAGLKQGRKGDLIHFSGVQLIESPPMGKYIETTLFDDTDLQALAGIPDSAAHRSIDLSIVNAVARGELYGSIVCPALVWGVGQGPCKRVSGLLPDLADKALVNRSAVYVGEGTNRWVTIHIDDLVDLTMHLVRHHLVDAKPQSPPAPHSTFYFASHPSSDQDFQTLARAVGEGLFDIGLLPSPTARSLPVPDFDPTQKGVRIEDDTRGEDEQGKRTPMWPSRTNCRCISARGKKQFGWEAKRTLDLAAAREDAKETARLMFALRSTI
ncbi:unnamed protein product [Sympodiomycopsis kandeliae]